MPHNEQVTSTPAIAKPTNVPLRLPSVRDLVCKQHYSEIRASLQQTAGRTGGRFTTQWNKALSATVNSLPADERKQHKDAIRAESTRRDLSPSKDDIFS